MGSRVFCEILGANWSSCSKQDENTHYAKFTLHTLWISFSSSPQHSPRRSGNHLEWFPLTRWLWNSLFVMYISRSGVLNWECYFPLSQGNIWLLLHIFQCTWQLKQRIIQPKMPMVSRLKKPFLDSLSCLPCSYLVWKDFFTHQPAEFP